MCPSGSGSRGSSCPAECIRSASPAGAWVGAAIEAVIMVLYITDMLVSQQYFIFRRLARVIWDILSGACWSAAKTQVRILHPLHLRILPHCAYSDLGCSGGRHCAAGQRQHAHSCRCAVQSGPSCVRACAHARALIRCRAGGSSYGARRRAGWRLRLRRPPAAGVRCTGGAGVWCAGGDGDRGSRRAIEQRRLRPGTCPVKSRRTDIISL